MREHRDPRAFRGLFRVRGAASFFWMDVVDQMFIGSGSFAFPAPRSFLPVTRSNLRGFPLNHRLLLTSLRSLAEARPSWASLLSRTRGHRCRPRSIGPGRFFSPTTSLEIRQGCPLIPFHRPHPRRSPSQGVATPSDSSSKLKSRSDLVVSHDFVGFLRRFARVLTELLITVQGDEGLAGLLRPAANRRVRCVSSAWSGGACPESAAIADTVSCWSLGFAVPRIDFRTPLRIPPACSRSTSPWSLPPRTFCRLRSATLPMNPFKDSPLLSYRRDLVPRGFAPLAGPYHRVPLPVSRWPTLPGPCSPSRSSSGRSLRFDRTSMMPCITVVPRLASAAIAFVPSIVFPRFLVGR